jgi:3-phenylpropionate/trans-cinnamate dioxygenase ferredoxin reductase subunit
MAAMVIIGAGECGCTAAFALREGGWDGEIVLIGDEPGLPYERPPLSKPEGGRVQRREVTDAARLDAARIDFRPATPVAAIDRARQVLRLDDGHELAYARLLLATGARPRALNLPGAEQALGLRTHRDALALFERAARARHAVLVGAGLIGLELAAVLQQRGLPVTVLEAGERVLARAVPAPLAERLAARHRAAGTHLRTGCRLARLEPGRVVLDDGETLPADLVVAAVGAEPRSELARAAGLAVDAAGALQVDAHLRTADPAVWAAGDGASAPSPWWPGRPAQRQENWRNAIDQGRHAARAMLVVERGEVPPVFDAVPWFWSDQHELGLQVAGWPDAGRPVWLRTPAPDQQLAFQLDDSGRLQCAAALGPGTTLAREVRLAERLIRQQARPAPEALTDPAVALRSLA